VRKKLNHYYINLCNIDILIGMDGQQLNGLNNIKRNNMNTPTKQTVYLPVKVEYGLKTELIEEEGYFFTPEQLNQLLSDVIKDNIEEVIKKGSVWSNGFGEDHDIYVIDYGEEGIRDTFDITFQKHKV